MTDFNKTRFSEFDSVTEMAAVASNGSTAEASVAVDAIWTLYGQAQENGVPHGTPVSTQPFTVGRHPDNTICLANGTVSGYHAEIVIAGDEILVRDKDSTNGTLLNGRRLKTVEVLREGDILHFGNVMFTVQKENQSLPASTVTVDDIAGDAIAQVQFSSLISRPGVEAYFQPIVRLDNLQRIGYEVLSRSYFIGLETPAKMFRVAAQRTSEAALSRVCRVEGMRVSQQFDGEMQFYLNTHPAELNRAELFESLYSLRKDYPTQKIVLEVHESGVTSVDFLRELRTVLKEVDFGLAYDDFGAGQARLTELIEVPPDVLKFDVNLVQGLPTATEARRSTVSGLINIVKDLNVTPLAEGIETQEEADICRDLGFELAQGFLFGRPEPVQKWLE